MYNYQLYHSDEIKKLKQELNVYKTVLSNIDNKHIAEDVMTIMDQNERLTIKMMKLKGDIEKMSENLDRQIKETEKKEKEIPAHIQTLDASFIELRQDVGEMMQKIENLQLAELVEKVNNILNNQDKEVHSKNEMDEVRAEMLQLKQQLEQKNAPETKQPPAPRASEFRRLQSMLQSENMLQAPNHAESNRIQPSLNQVTQSSQSAMVNQRNRNNFTLPNHQRKTSQPNGVNRNIITRIKTANQENEQIVKKKPSNEMNTDEQIKIQSPLAHEETTKKIETTTLSNTNDIEPIQSEMTVTKKNNIVPNHLDKPIESPEKTSIFSIFRKS